MNTIIIGSGIGGMACAAVLASKGIKVKVLEQQQIIFHQQEISKKIVRV